MVVDARNVLPSRANKENVILVWFESRPKNDEIDARLRSINDYAIIYDDLDRCRTDIRLIRNEKIVLITCGPQSEDLLSTIASLPSIEAIFIFDTIIDHVPKLGNANRKLAGIFLEWHDLEEKLREYIRQMNKNLEIINLFSTKQRSSKDLHEETVEFRWFQLFTYVISLLPRDQRAKSQMLDECRRYYHGNKDKLRDIDEFDRIYQSDQAIAWYTRESFVYQLINRAFRSEDFDQLYKFRFFISDLSRCIAHEHRLSLVSDERVWIVYRGTQLPEEEFQRLKSSVGRHHSMNGFLSASLFEHIAQQFATSQNKANHVAVLFEIICDVKTVGEQVKFADIRSLSSHPNEQEVLFDVNSIFHVQSIEEQKINDSTSLWRVIMRASTTGQIITHPYMQETSRQIEEMGATIVYGRLICNKGYYKKALEYFLNLFDDANDDKELAWIEFNIGRSYRFQGEFDKAREFYDRAYNRMMNKENRRIKDSARVIRNIGKVLQDKAKYDEALKFYQRALEIQETFLDSNHPDIANCLTSIGSVYDAQEDYQKALTYFKRAFDIQQESLPLNHPDIANVLSHIGSTLKHQKILNDALDYFRRALEMREHVVPLDHPDIAYDLTNIGSVRHQQGENALAFEYYQKALEIQEKSLSSEHWHIARSLIGIADIYSSERKYNKAIAHYHEGLNILEKCLHPDHPQIAFCLTNLGTTLRSHDKNEEALEYLQRALHQRKKTLPANHPLIADLYNEIGHCYESFSKLKTALKYYKDALNIYEVCLPARLWHYEHLQQRIRQISSKI